MKKYHVFVIAFLIAICLLFVYLWTENNQKGWAFYRFQSRIGYWIGKYEEPIILPPLNYTGEWTTWSSDGRKSIHNQVQGRLKGKTTNWDANGKIHRIIYFDTSDCLQQWFDDGVQIARCALYNNKPWYGKFLTERASSYTPTNNFEYYLNYKMVSKEEYEKWEKESGGVDKLLEAHPEILR